MGFCGGIGKVMDLIFGFVNDLIGFSINSVYSGIVGLFIGGGIF